MLDDLIARYPMATGLIGMMASLGSALLSTMQDADIIIRVLGGVIGLGIGLLTLIIQIRNLINKPPK